MMHLLVFLMVLAAFLALAAGMKRHQRDLLGRTLPFGQTRVVRSAGWLLLAAGWVLDTVLLGPAVGTLAILGEASISAWLSIAIINRQSARAGR
ncbi:DUF3325 family protein [Novosphingobium soli]|uniref:DUF3325 family protein n=1 Tax=Novosphingobium soli TaxID=574956 RepID=A0ABV6CVA1_9SPHN